MPLQPTSHGPFPIPPPRSSRGTAPRIAEDPQLPGLLQELTRAREAGDQSRAMTECLVKALDELKVGFAIHEILTDADHQPIDFRFLQVNEGFERLTGLTRIQLIGRTVMECFPSTDASWIAVYGKVALGGDQLRFEAIAGRCGRILEITSFQSGKGRFAMVFQDVTATRELEGALEKTRATLRQLIDSAGEMIFIVAQENLLYSNLACSMVTGYSPDELEARGLVDLLVPEHRATYREMLQRFSSEEGYCTRREFRLATRDGGILCIALGARPIDWEGVPAILHFAVELQDKTLGEVPVRQESISATPNAETAVISTPERGPDLPIRTPMILLVDDEPQLLGLSQRILQRHGFRTHAFSSPLPALSTWTGDGTPPDLVVTDIDMPDMNGFDFCRRVRTLHPGQNFLFVTGSPARLREFPPEFSRETNLLMKPFSSEALVHAVQRQLAGATDCANNC